LLFDALDLPRDGALSQSGDLRRPGKAAGFRHQPEEMKLVRVERTP
jgi:hypothetical protein